MKRKLNITTKTSDLSEVLKNLKLSEDFKNNATFTLEVEIEETTENYKYLSSSNKIIDWSFIDDEEERVIAENKEEINEIKSDQTCVVCNNNSDNSCCVMSDYEKTKREISEFNLKNYSDIIRLFDSFREAKIYNEFIQLDDINIKNIIRPLYLEKLGKKYGSDLEFLVSTSYFGSMLSDDVVIYDIVNKINAIWSYIQTFPNISSLINKLYN